MIPTLCKRNSYQRGAPGVSELIGGGSFEDNNSSDDDDFLNQSQPVSEDGVTPKYRRDTTRVGLGKGCRTLVTTIGRLSNTPSKCGSCKDSEIEDLVDQDKARRARIYADHKSNTSLVGLQARMAKIYEEMKDIRAEFATIRTNEDFTAEVITANMDSCVKHMSIVDGMMADIQERDDDESESESDEHEDSRLGEHIMDRLTYDSGAEYEDNNSSTSLASGVLNVVMNRWSAPEH